MTEKTKNFIKKIKEIGHWNINYDYSLVEYKNQTTKVVFICKKHGKFNQTPSNHLNKKGCPKCGIEKRAKKNVISKSLLINQFIEKHGKKYDYSLVDYINTHTKVKIICKTHGIFEQTPARHKSGSQCPECSKIEASLRQRSNVDTVIRQFKQVHGSEYDYSLVDYINTHTKVKIICKTHGIFEQTPSNHQQGQKCFKCKGVKKFDNKTIINDFKKIHGDRYNYSLVEYKNTKTKVKIICKIHGEFTQSPNGHKAGRGCPKCSGKHRYSKEEILDEFKKVHGNKYDYSLVDYKNTKEKIKIICKKHGTFEQSPLMHKNGRGCSKCYGRDLTNNEIIKEFKKIHGNRYDYSLVDYIKNSVPVKIICKIHGEFEQLPSIHKIGSGCRKCSKTHIYTQDEIIKEFKKIHRNKYDYSIVKYINSTSPIQIICKKHGVFTQLPIAHKSGSGCQTCGNGWNAERIANFINDIRNEDVLKMDDVELNMLISQGKLPKEFEELVFKLDGTGENSLKTLKEKLGIEDELELSSKKIEQIEKEIGNILSEHNNEVNDSLDTNLSNSPSIEDIESQNESIKNRKLPSISSSDILVLDKELINNCDDEAVEFFIQYKLRKVWNEVINDKRSADEIKSLNGGKNSSRLRDLFIDEYNKVIKYTPPAGYSFIKKGKIAPPNMMQKLTVNRIREYKRYGNWSGTGAGKTLSFIIASREVNARLTVVVCLNSTVTQLGEDILEVYPDSIIHEYKKGEIYDRNKYNFLLLNYEKFQQGYSEEMLQELNKNNTIDFIVIDEVHNAKQRDKDESKRRGALMRLIGRSAETNPNFHLLGMSATPVINNLIEAKSLLQLISGKEYDDINTRGTISNALKVFSQLLLNGIRYIPKYNIVLNEITGENNPKLLINGESLTDKLKENNSKDYLGLEKILLELKLEYTKPFIKPRTIIYTYFTDNNRIPKRIGKFIKSLGLSYDYYIGEQNTAEREESKENFVKGNVDILIASRTIGTGVDGLQDVCNRMILLTLPWTDSEYTQLKGRIYRQGSEFGEVDIVIPQVYIDLENIKWSWDKQRLQLIRDKRTLADAAVDGIIPSKHLPTRTKLCSDSLKALKDWQKRVSEGNISITNRREIELPLRPEIIEYLRPSLGDFSKLNQTWSVSRSNNTFERLKKDKSEWEYYHTLYRQKRKDWDEIPYIEIAKKINKREDWIVADMGCGENLLAKEIPNKVHGFDYVACEEGVVACDISNVPLKDNSVDVVVFSLSLMGSNYIDYVKEGYRILKPFGFMFICEPYKKMEGRIDNYKNKLEEIGFNVTSTKNSSKKFVYIDCMK